MSNQQDIKLSEVFEQDSKVTLDENTRLSFAKQVLFWLILLCVSVFIAHGVYPDNKGVSDVFEFIKIGALPLVTLVVSFYFPNSK